jgi:hypothetical protein
MTAPIPFRRRGLSALFVVLALAAAVALVTLSGRADPVFVDRTPGTHTVAEIEAAMVRLVEPYTTHPVIADPAYRREIAEATFAAARASSIPEMFLTGMFYRESSYAKKVISGERRGKLGEYGLGQLNVVARHWCRRKGYDLKAISGQALCSAAWLAFSRDMCDGILVRGFAMYSTGRSCNPRFAGDVVRDRFDLWKALETGGPLPGPRRRSK